MTILGVLHNRCLKGQPQIEHTYMHSITYIGSLICLLYRKLHTYVNFNTYPLQ